MFNDFSFLLHCLGPWCGMASLRRRDACWDITLAPRQYGVLRAFVVKYVAEGCFGSFCNATSRASTSSHPSFAATIGQ